MAAFGTKNIHSVVVLYVKSEKQFNFWGAYHITLTQAKINGFKKKSNRATLSCGISSELFTI